MQDDDNLFVELKNAVRSEMQRLRAGLRFSRDGFRAAFQSEAAFRLEVVLALVLIPLALIIGYTSFKKALLVGSILLVLMVELLNTAVETVVNLVCPDQHPLAKKAKDLGSAAVTLALVNAVMVWLLLVVLY